MYTTSKTLGSGSSGFAVCISLCLHHYVPSTIERNDSSTFSEYFASLQSDIPSHPLLYQLSRLVNLLEFMDVSYKPLIFLFILFVSSSLILSSRHSLLLFLICLLASGLTSYILFTLLWFRSYNYCIVTCILCFKNCEHSSSNHGLRCFHEYRTRLFITQMLILA